MQPLKLLRQPTFWGAGGLVLAVVVSLVAAWIYIAPPGQKVVTFYTADAASIHPGDQVRIAGIAVGKVKDLAMESDRVRVRARVDGAAFVGNQSQVQVRMLTVVGGYYVNIVSLGSTPLGATPIPLDRVTMPYNLMQTLADSTKITSGIDPKPLKESLDQLQKGFAGDNVATLGAIIDAGNGLTATIQEQRGQISQILNFSNEYIESLNNFSDGLRDLVRKTALLEQVLILYGEGFGEGLKELVDVLNALTPISYFYLKHRDKFLEMVKDLTVKARMWTDQQGAIVRGLRAMRNKIERVLDAQNAPPDLLATDICMPVPGTSC